MKKPSLLLIFLFSFACAYSQNNIAGQILDEKTGEALPFATVIVNNVLATVSDTDGKFQFNTSFEIEEIEVSYIGYYKSRIETKANKDFYTIKLKVNPSVLNEVVVVDERINPALVVIKQVIANKKINNPDRVLNTYQYSSYSKFIVTANPDSIPSKIDSVWNKKNGKLEFSRLDSSDYKFKKEISSKHLYLTEKISEYRFKKGSVKQEEVLASRMAGFKEPIYEILALNLQSLSFYDDYYKVLGIKYLNPIEGSSALKHYQYKMLDTIHNSFGDTYMIYFKAKEKKEVADLEGLLYVDSRNYAISKAIVELKAILRVSATLSFDYLPKQNIWFPKETELNLKKGEDNQGLMLFGSNIKINAESDSSSRVRSNKGKRAEDFIYLNSKSSNFNLKVNEDVKIMSPSIELLVDENAHKRDSIFWENYRKAPLDQRGMRTYAVLDSIVEKEGVENDLKKFRALIDGYYPSKYFYYDLNSILDFNPYEGFKLGLGGKTSEDFSNIFNIESYAKYGFRDGRFKGSLGLNFRLNKYSNTWVGATYSYDYFQSSKTNFISDDRQFLISDLQRVNNGFLASETAIKLHLSHDINAKLKSRISLEKRFVAPLFDYYYLNKDNLLDNYFDLSQLVMSFDWQPNSQYIQTRRGRNKIKQGFPIVSIQYSKGFEKILNGEYDFNKFDLRIHHQIESYSLGLTDIYFVGGLMNDAPLPLLYGSNPNSTLQMPWAKRINMSGDFHFETMLFKEFFNNKYAELHLRHKFNAFDFGNSFKPRLALVLRGAIGSLDNTQSHSGLIVKDLSKGYFETGAEIERIYKGFGIGSYYRLGQNIQSKWSDNLFVKINFKFELFN